MKNKMKISLWACALGIVFFTACKRNQITNIDDTTTAASDNAMGEWIYNDAHNIADLGSETASGDNLTGYKTTSNCATVTHDTLSTPKTITIDFGPTNCLCNDGRNRRGQIIVSYIGKYRDSGHVHTLSFNNYYVNDHHVMGSKTVENMGHNASGQSYFNISVIGLVVKSNGDTVNWNSTRVRTWIGGESTLPRLDDVYSITGSGSGSRPNGTSYTMQITQPLIKELSCQWFTQGVVELQPSNKPLRTINYGNGSCDNQATVTVNGNTYNITLN